MYDMKNQNVLTLGYARFQFSDLKGQD
jgi:hypothetical protein